MFSWEFKKPLKRKQFDLLNKFVDDGLQLLHQKIGDQIQRKKESTVRLHQIFLAVKKRLPEIQSMGVEGLYHLSESEHFFLYGKHTTNYLINPTNDDLAKHILVWFDPLYSTIKDIDEAKEMTALGCTQLNNQFSLPGLNNTSLSEFLALFQPGGSPKTNWVLLGFHQLRTKDYYTNLYWAKTYATILRERV